jgi:D-serine deaminase-like pyridoxal phosphate-dependent protein
MTPWLAQDRAILGRPGSRALIDTPALVLDLDALERNIATMAAIARERGMALRPHAKTHKSAAIARLQAAAGAVGQCVAKLSEAEALADKGIGGLLVSAAVPDPAKIARLVALRGRSPDLIVVVETPETVDALGAAVAAAGLRLDVLIDVDVGTHRFGVPTVAAVLALAERIARQPALRFRGLQGYAGHLQAMPDHQERRAASHAALRILADARDALRARGQDCPIVSGGGTGTHDFEHETGVLNELQVGSYLFMDVIYDGVALTPDGSRRFENALWVQARVLSCQHDGFATIDAGFKSFATDGPPPRIRAGAPEGSVYERFGDEFGKVVLPDRSARLPVGTLVECIVPHCDPNVNLFDHYHVVRGDRLVDLWRIDARGCTR